VINEMNDCGGSARAEAGLARPEMVFEIRRADGAEGRRLADEQARAIREVIRWIARRRSGAGRDHAA
jgi:hypothetical protein